MSLKSKSKSHKGAQLTLVSHAEGFFHELITTTMGQAQIKASPNTEFYLVNLLNQFLCTDRLFPGSSQGQAKEEPLAFLWKEALETPEVQSRASVFRHIGDVTLYISGFFQDSLYRKLVDIDYYIHMGSGAYVQAANLSSSFSDGQRFVSVYEELSKKFPRFVDVLAEVSSKTLPKTEKDLLRLYEVWMQTGSERAAKKLQEAGIVPNDTIKKDWQ